MKKLTEITEAEAAALMTQLDIETAMVDARTFCEVTHVSTAGLPQEKIEQDVLIRYGAC